MPISRIETASLDSALVAPTATALTTASGSAPSYSARAWVNFNGTTSPITIRASGNVTSITDEGTGQYTVNLTTALQDVNYSVVAIGGFNNPTANQATYYIQDNVTTTLSFRINGVSGNTLAFTDHTTVCVAVFR